MGQGMWRIWGRGELYIGFWWGNLRERYHLEDPGVDCWIYNINTDFQEVGWRAWTGLNWLRIGTCDIPL
jgi:hypothetical protein